MTLWLVHAKEQQRDRQQTGDDGDPKCRSKVIGPQQHQAYRQQWAKKRTDRVQRLAQSKGCAANLCGRDIGDQGVTWRATHALANPI